ncbi:MAG TPA: DinB family protein [Candidatus Angelobacter sp.]|nr:DinB family protein [Candidatus Angelobacter sp.]
MPNSNVSRLQRCETQLQDFLGEALRGVSPDALTHRAVPDKWSALENLAHLARYHQVFLERVERILADHTPSFPRYRAEDDPEWPRWNTMPPQQLLATLSGLRTKLMARLRSLNEEDFSRTGVHSRFGEMTLALWLEFFLVHEGHHLNVVLSQRNIWQARS